MKIEESWFRNIGFISYRAAGGKERNIQKFWSIGDSKKEPIKKVLGNSPEEIQQTIEMIKKAHNLNIKAK